VSSAWDTSGIPSSSKSDFGHLIRSNISDVRVVRSCQSLLLAGLSGAKSFRLGTGSSSSVVSNGVSKITSSATARTLRVIAAPGWPMMETMGEVAEHAVPALRARLRHVYWIGGGSGAGKSTIARRLAARYGLRVYATDAVMPDHARRSAPGDCPFLDQFAAMDIDQRWVNRSPHTMLETFHWFRGEGFSLIVEDLLRLPPEPGVIAEGFRLLPHLVKPLLATPGHAIWLLPTPGFRRAALGSRGSLWQIAGKTSDPQRALRNLLERDQMFTERLNEEASGLALPIIEVDTTTTEDDLARRVTEAFGF
jgi:hypothetical protein